jgi:hypothetical protein
MKRYRKLLLGLLSLIGSVYVYGFYLALQRPYFEERPAQIDGLDCEEYQFKWIDPQTKETVYSTAWCISLDHAPDIELLKQDADTIWSISRNDTVVAVNWSEDITIETATINGKILSYTVYLSEQFQ